MIERLVAGDESVLPMVLEDGHESIRLLVARNLRGFIRSLVDDSDIVQEVCIDLIQATKTVRVRSVDAFWALVARIVASRIATTANHLGRTKRGIRRTFVFDDVPAELERLSHAESDGPMARAGRKEVVERIRCALDLLKPSHREVIELRVFQGRRFATIGSMVGVKEDAARLRFARAIAELERVFARLGVGSRQRRNPEKRS